MDQANTLKRFGKTYRRDVPDGTVMRDARFYVMFREPYLELIAPQRTKKTKMFYVGTPGWKELGGAHRSNMNLLGLPKGWRMEIYSDEDQSLVTNKCIVPHTVEQAAVDWFPDIYLWVPFPLVRKRVKEFLQDHDPAGNQFYPAELLIKETGEAVLGGPYYWWMVRRRLWSPEKYHLPRGRAWHHLVAQDGLDRDTAWALVNDAQLQDALKHVPTWTIAFSSNLVFSRDTFAALKAERFTGLIEHRKLNFDVDTIGHNANIGHIV